MSWYREWFSDPDYLLLYQHRDDSDAEQIINLLESKINLSPFSSILDLACGNGRHSIQLAKRGYQVTGFDLSNSLLDIARQNADEAGLQIDFIQGDMREMDLKNQFDLIINLFTSFGYFDSDSENEKVIRNISSALKTNGIVFIDYLNKTNIINNLQPETFSELNGLKIIQKRKIVNNRVLKDIIIRKGGKEAFYNEAVTLYSLDDFRNFFTSSGLSLTDVFGDYNGQPFSDSSPRMIMIGKK